MGQESASAVMASTSARKSGGVLNIYGDFITKNAHAVSQIESALRSLTYIVPGTVFPRQNIPDRCLGATADYLK